MLNHDANEALNRLEVVGLARLAHAMLRERGGDLDASALLHLEHAIELLETTIMEQRRSVMRAH